ncbi:glycosyltransferase involved in cell wall biosynthesis [Skermanella aerolata]|nr:glycosyltransferase family A protein [Skermanella aerolata]KJB92333.1 glycosyl transferase [Skermanella aerolata KACC 11604]
MSFAITRLLLLQQLVLMIPKGIKETVRATLFPPRAPLDAPVEWLETPPVRRDQGQPLVSVVIPCYNYGRFLNDAVASVRAQTLRDVEIIVVDDGSTDDVTPCVLDALEGPDQEPGLTVIRQENQGAPAARNTGIKAARGLYICCLDADDTMEPTYLEKCVLLMEGNAGVSLAYSWLRVTGAEERVWKSESLDLDRMRYYNHVSISAVFRREAGLEGGGFCAAMREGYEDWEFWLRLGARGYRGEVIPEMLVNYRRHEASFMNRARKRHAELFDDIYRRNPAVFEDGDSRRAVRRGYRDLPVRNPFANLDDPDQYGHMLPMVVLVLSGAADADTVGRLVKLLRNDPALCVVQAGDAPAGGNDGSRDGSAVADYTLKHLLPSGLHGGFVAHLVRTRPVRAVLWHDPGAEPVGLAEVSGLAPDDLLLGAVTRPDGHVPPGLDLHLVVRPDGSLSGAEHLSQGLHPVLVR